MAGFGALILIRPDQAAGQSKEDFIATADMQEEVQRLIAPYDENLCQLRAEPCECIGLAARFDAAKVADAQIGRFIDIRNRFVDEHRMGDAGRKPHGFHGLTLDMILAWDEATAPYYERAWEVFNSHPLRDKPVPNCSEDVDVSFGGDGILYCGGTGVVMSDLNLHDGHWDGFYVDKIFPSTPSNSMAYAIVTPDGIWRERGLVGWSEMRWDYTPLVKWREMFAKSIAENQDCVGVEIGCHY